MNPQVSHPPPAPLAIAGAAPSPRSRRTVGEQGQVQAWIGQTIQLQWCSTRQARETGERLRMVRSVFVLEIEVLDAGHVLMEAWIDNEGTRRSVLERRPMHAQISADAVLLHVDVPTDESGANHRLASVSIRMTDDPAAVRPVFAQTSLMIAAGFGAGTCDPPTLHVAATQRGIASA